MDIYTKQKLNLMNNQETDKEIRLFLMLELLHDKVITLKKAQSLCVELNYFENSVIETDAKTTYLFEQKLNENKGVD